MSKMPELLLAFPLADTRNSILEAALVMFAEHGFHGSVMREIAKKAEVSQGLLHHHFGNKEGLWNKVGEQISAGFSAYMTEVLGPDELTETSVAAGARAYMSYWKEHPAAFRFNHWRLLEGPSEERNSRSEVLNDQTVPLIKRAQEAGFVRDDLPAGFAMVIVGALTQFWLHSETEFRGALAVTGDADLDDDTFLEYVLDLISANPKKRTASESNDETDN